MLVPVMLAMIITDMAPDPFFSARSLFGPKMNILQLEFQQNPILMTLLRAKGAQAFFVNRVRPSAGFFSRYFDPGRYR